MERLRRFTAAWVLAGAFYGCRESPPQNTTAQDIGFSVTTLCAPEHPRNNLVLGPHIDMIIDAQKMPFHGELWVFVKEGTDGNSSTVSLKDSQKRVEIHGYFSRPFLLIKKGVIYKLEVYQDPEKLLATATVKPFC